jgi:hypothetical protein
MRTRGQAAQEPHENLSAVKAVAKKAKMSRKAGSDLTDEPVHKRASSCRADRAGEAPEEIGEGIGISQIFSRAATSPGGMSKNRSKAAVKAQASDTPAETTAEQPPKRKKQQPSLQANPGRSDDAGPESTAQHERGHVHDAPEAATGEHAMGPQLAGQQGGVLHSMGLNGHDVGVANGDDDHEDEEDDDAPEEVFFNEFASPLPQINNRMAFLQYALQIATTSIGCGSVPYILHKRHCSVQATVS